MRSRLLSVLSLSAATMFATSGSATTRSTDPVGFMRYQVNQGLQTIGFPLLEGVTTRGRVTSMTTGALSSTATASWLTRLDPTRSYYVEFVSGPDDDKTFVGDRLEVDVASTLATGSGAIHVSTVSSHSTLAALPPELLDYEFVVRPHLTLASVFGAGPAVLNAGANPSTGDQVYAMRDGSFEVFLLRQTRGSSTAQWVKFPEGTPANEVPIAPGTGLFVRRMNSAPATLHHIGYVRTNDFVQPLAAGYTLASEPFPIDASFASRGMTELNGFTAGQNSTSSDSVSLWNGGGYRTVFFALTNNTAPTWRSLEPAAQSAEVSANAFSPFRAALIQKLAADPAYVVPSPW